MTHEKKSFRVIANNYNNLYKQSAFVDYLTHPANTTSNAHPGLLTQWSIAIRIFEAHYRTPEFKRLIIATVGSIDTEGNNLIFATQDINDQLKMYIEPFLPCKWNRLCPSNKKILVRYLKMIFRGMEPLWLMDAYERFSKVKPIRVDYVSNRQIRNTTVIYRKRRTLEVN